MIRHLLLFALVLLVVVVTIGGVHAVVECEGFGRIHSMESARRDDAMLFISFYVASRWLGVVLF